MAEAKANPYSYAGYTYDKEIEQYYLMARYYDPEQGVFTAVDPDPGNEDDPQTMNGYNYANNTPVMYMDPDGNFAIAAPVIYWGASAAIAAAPFVGYGIGKAGSWVSKKAKKRRKAYKTLWKYRKPIARTIYKKTRRYWKRTVRKFSKGGKQRIGDTAYQGTSSSRLKELYGKAKGKEKQRIKRELKNRGEANKQKRRSK
nr:RHS repeat-associated core domain-containing protein [Listeria immobilis]